MGDEAGWGNVVHVGVCVSQVLRAIRIDRNCGEWAPEMVGKRKNRRYAFGTPSHAVFSASSKGMAKPEHA